jgi:hypothetical protein
MPLFLIVALVIVLAFGLGAWRGAPYLPILRRPAEELLDLAELKPGQTLIDLGSGDGRLLKLAAKRGIKGIGYEINPWLWLISRLNCWAYRDRVKLHLADYWLVRLPPADAIAVFLIDRYMGRLDSKLSSELTRPTVLVSYVFALPQRRPERTTKNSFRYRYQNGKNN